MLQVVWIWAFVTIRRDRREYKKKNTRAISRMPIDQSLYWLRLTRLFHSLSRSFIKRNNLNRSKKHSNSMELCWWRFPSRWKHNGPQQRDERDDETRKRNKEKREETQKKEERKTDEALEGLRWMFRPLVWPLQKIVKEQTSDSLAVITVAKEMQQQQDQNGSQQDPTILRLSNLRATWMKFYLALFSPLYLLVFPFSSAFFCCCLRVSSFFLFSFSRRNSDRIYLWLRICCRCSYTRTRHGKFHNYQSIKGRGRGWNHVMEFYEKSSREPKRNEKNRGGPGPGRSNMEPHWD